MKKWIFILLGTALLGGGCTQYAEQAAEITPRATVDSMNASDSLVGLNKARAKVNTQMGVCPSAVIRIGTYNDTDDIKQVALTILQKRNPRIAAEYLEVEKTPFMNFTTDPPTPAKGETMRTLLRPDGSIESYSVESSQTVLVKIKSNFYNTYYSRMEDNPDCKGYRPIDNSCIGSLEFTKRDVLMSILYPC